MRPELSIQVDFLIQRLWPRDGGETAEVCALLDAARDPRILPLVRRSRLDVRCLFRGRVPPALAAAAPYLVSLSPRAALTREILEQGWGASWGIFVRSPAILPELARHFRRLLTVQDENGRELLFRFYDPRVLRVYLPTCTPAELITFFGPVETFSLESEEGEEKAALLEMTHRKGELTRRIVYVGG